jgi:hypothetical protein
MIHAGAGRGLASLAGRLWTMFSCSADGKVPLAGRAAGVPGPRVSFLGCGDGLVLVRARPHIAGGRQQRRGMPTSPGPIDSAHCRPDRPFSARVTGAGLRIDL